MNKKLLAALAVTSLFAASSAMADHKPGHKKDDAKGAHKAETKKKKKGKGECGANCHSKEKAAAPAAEGEATTPPPAPAAPAAGDHSKDDGHGH